MDIRDQYASMPFVDHAAAIAAGKVTVSYIDADGATVEASLPCRAVVCNLCNGRGSHVNPSIDAGGISREDFDRDPDFEEAYFAGAYDVACYSCHGNKVCAVPQDRDNFSPEDRETFDAWQAFEREEAEFRREQAAERAWGY